VQEKVKAGLGLVVVGSEGEGNVGSSKPVRCLRGIAL